MGKKNKIRGKKKSHRQAKTSSRQQPFSANQDLMQRAVSMYQSGDLNKSEVVLKTILKKEPYNQNALNLLGVIAIHSGKFDIAILCFSKTIKANPKNINANINLAFALIEKGKCNEAITYCQKALDLDPNNVSALNNLANAHKEKKDYHKAISTYEKIIGIKPDFAEAYFNMGIVYQKLSEYSTAIKLYEKAISLNAKYFKAYNNLSIVKREQGFLDEAVNLCEKAISLNPDYPDAYYNLSLIKREKGLLNDALILSEKAISLNPCFSEAYNILIAIKKEQGFYTEAIELSEKVFSLNQDNSDTLTLQGMTYLELSRMPEAEKCFSRALEINAHDVTALLNLGIVNEQSNNTQKAKKYYYKALQEKPDHIESITRLIYLLRNTCDWDGLPELEYKLDELTDLQQIKEVEKFENPFLNLLRQDDAHKNHKVASSYGARLSKRMKSLGVTFSYEWMSKAQKKIRIGYLSGDFRNHPVSHQILQLFDLHDRHEFEVYCFSHGINDESIYRDKIKNDCDKFIDIRQTTFLEAAQTINKNEIDILVDLGGHTKGSRLEICALRPAPLQISYLGYPGATGCDFMNYLVGDSVVVPQAHLNCYSEKIIFMPHSFMITDDSQHISLNNNKSKIEYSLPENTFIFGSFSRHYKIDVHTFDLWMKILDHVQDSVLWLSRANKDVQDHLRKEAGLRNIDPERLIFAGFEEKKEDHLARLSFIDLALDTLIYNGHTTTTDLLWAGVPVLTIRGNHFASRVSASVLNALGLNELISTTTDEFISGAVKVASNKDELKKIRNKLAENIHGKSLFNTERYVKNFETGLKLMYSQYVFKKDMDHIFV